MINGRERDIEQMAGKIQLKGKYLRKALKILKYVTNQLEQNDIPY